MKKHKKLGDFLFYFVFSAIILVGVGLLAYPTVANWYNKTHASRAISAYAQSIESIDPVDYDAMLAAAREYNENLIKAIDRWEPSEDETAYYNSILDVTGTGIMGYVEIPSIKVLLPIYHGTAETTLQIAVGHLEGSSFPVEGESTHVVMSGHSALPSAKLFTDLHKVAIGDTFMVHVLKETLTYQVDQIETVLPYELDLLEIEEGHEYCTLVTCTPYGVNSHRLLVRGSLVTP